MSQVNHGYADPQQRHNHVVYYCRWPADHHYLD